LSRGKTDDARVVIDQRGREWVCRERPSETAGDPSRVTCVWEARSVELVLYGDWRRIGEAELAVLIQGAEHQALRQLEREEPLLSLTPEMVEAFVRRILTCSTLEQLAELAGQIDRSHATNPAMMAVNRTALDQLRRALGIRRQQLYRDRAGGGDESR
jgi:hypothetical protein